MTAQELALYSAKAAQYQIQKALEATPEPLWDAKLVPSTMSPAEAAEHICEALMAFLTMAQGKEWDWGSYSAPDKTKRALLRTLEDLSKQAISLIETAEDDNTLTGSVDYVALHGAYHVGQISMLLVEKDPTWDAYSIYPGE